jgi:hypothetical protein
MPELITSGVHDDLELKTFQDDKTVNDHGPILGESQQKKTLINNLIEKVVIKSCLPINNKRLNEIMIFLMISGLSYLLAFILFDNKCYPCTLAMPLVLLVISAHVCGYLIEFIKLPSLLGMLIVGIIFRNFSLIQFSDPSTSSLLR